jgi:hypothetical protein
MPKYEFRVNGRMVSVDSLDPGQPLLYILRNTLGQPDKLRSRVTETVRLVSLDRLLRRFALCPPFREKCKKWLSLERFAKFSSGTPRSKH